MTREEAIELAIKACEKTWNEKTCKQIRDVLEQEPKTGHWYIDERPESNREVICSNCDQPIFKYHRLDFDYRPKYCPNCGCRMVEPQEKRCADCNNYGKLSLDCGRCDDDCNMFKPKESEGQE